MWIRFGLNSDPGPTFYLNANPDQDPGIQTNADPDRDPGQTLPSQKVDFFCALFHRLLHSSTRHIEKVEGGERDTQVVRVNEATVA